MSYGLLWEDVAIRDRVCSKCKAVIPKGSACIKYYHASICDDCFLEAMAVLSIRNMHKGIFTEEFVAKAVSKRI